MKRKSASVLNHATKYQKKGVHAPEFKEIIAEIASDSLEMEYTPEFKKLVKKLITDSLSLESVRSVQQDYQVVLKEEIEQKDKNSEYTIDYAKIEQKRVNLFNSINQNNINFLDRELIEEEKFKNEFAKLNEILNRSSKLNKSLIANNENGELDKYLKDLSRKLEVDYEGLKHFYHMGMQQYNALNTPQTISNKTQKPYYELPKLPELYEKMGIDDEDVRDLEEILNKIELLSNVEKAELKTQYDEVKKHYDNTWKNKSAEEIRRWAEDKKGKLLNEEVYEAIAVMDRANKFATGGHNLRDTQILSVLTFLQTKESQDKGKLCQISTGEGKTTIVSLLAALKVLQGEKVDVITSNEVLAVEGVKDKDIFYQLFGIFVNHNNANEKYINGPRECYKADIVYGSIGNFQFDYLRDEFEGYGTRADRGFGTVILDEVDSMLIDNGGHIAKLSGPFPGMDSLRYVHIRIWQLLNKVEAELHVEFQAKLKSKAEQLEKPINGYNITEDKAQAEYNEFKKKLADSFIGTLKEKIKSANSTNIELLPKHVKDYANKKLDQWIDNAIHAKYTCNENEHYVIRKRKAKEGEEQQSGEEMIIPVDYANTGVTMQNTIWSYGLHQFIQLKHNLEVTPESLTSSFVSNLSYIKKYGNKIFGLTGTLGSKPEQDLLSIIYNIDYAKIPTFKPKKFEEDKGKVVEDKEWSTVVALDALERIEQGRAVLIICQTIKDLNSIKQNLEILKTTTEFEYNIKEYVDESNSHVTEEELKPRDIVIATNIAGRGTDLKTTAELEDNGGLHVCISFLPCNKRVEDQAFGRTARQGKKGTAELIIRKSEVAKLGINIENTQVENLGLEVVKQKRDNQEQKRIEEIKATKIHDIIFQDALFSNFCTLYTELKGKIKKAKNYSDPSNIQKEFALKDLKEFWAFWLEENVMSQKLDTQSADPKTLFNKFKLVAQKIIDGEIKHNPYYNIQLAEYYLEQNDIQNTYIHPAKNALNAALSMGTSSNILYTAYIKLFEVEIESGWVLMQRFKDAMAKVAIFGYFVSAKNENYKTEAKNALENAQQALQKEIKYFQDNFFLESEIKNELRTILIPSAKENLLIKHLNSRFICLNTYKNSTDSLLEELKKDTHNGLAINSRIPNYLKDLKPTTKEEAKFREAITNSELADLKNIGLDTIYALREVHNVPTETIALAQGQILGGLSLLAASIAFPPSAVVTAPLASTMISEGICDIVVELISRGNEGFDVKAYAKSKAVSYGISIITMGLSTLVTCTKILEKAIKACKKLSDLLKGSKYMTELCTKIADKIDKIGKWIEKVNDLNKFTKLDKLNQIEHLENLVRAGEFEKLKHLGGLEKLSALKHVQELTKLQSFAQSLGNITLNSTKGVATSMFMEKVVTASINEMMQGLKGVIKKGVIKEISSKLNKEKLESVNQQDVYKTLSEVMTGNLNDTIKEVAQEIALGVARHSSSWKMQLGTLVIDGIASGTKIYNYINKICCVLNEKLEHLTRGENNSIGEEKNNHIEKIIDQIAEQISEILYSHVVGLTGKVVTTLPKIAYSAHKKHIYKQEKKRKSEEIEKENKEDLRKCYDILDLKEGVSLKEIVAAYRKKALVTHPDKGGSKEEFQLIQNAYDKLQGKSNCNINTFKNESSPPISKKQKSDPDNQISNANVSKDCTIAAIANSLGLDKGQIKKKLGIKIGSNGASINDVKNIHKTLGFSSHEKKCNLDNLEGDIEKFFKKHKTDKALLFYEGESNHAVVVKFRNKDLWVLDNHGQKKCRLSECDNKFKVVTALTIPGLKGAKIKEQVQKQVKNMPDTSQKQWMQTGQNLEEVNFGAIVNIKKKDGNQTLEVKSDISEKDILKSLSKMPQGAILAGGAAVNLQLEFPSRAINDFDFVAPQEIIDSMPKANNGKPYIEIQGKKIVFSSKTDNGTITTSDYPIYNKDNKVIGRVKVSIAVQQDIEIKPIEKDGVKMVSIMDLHLKLSGIIEQSKGDKKVNRQEDLDNLGISLDGNSLQRLFENPIDSAMYHVKSNSDNQLTGLSQNLSNNMIGISSYFGKYTLEAIKDILKLRIKEAKLENVKILEGSYIFLEDYNNVKEMLLEATYSDAQLTLIPFNLFNKHAVGFITVKQEQNLILYYIDPSNDTMPEELKNLLRIEGIKIEQLQVELQKYTNCGPEVIENFILFLTGERLSQEEAVPYHSYLLERKLLSKVENIQEAFLSNQENLNIVGHIEDCSIYDVN